jgi:N-acetylglucosaminyl-diphospho-decaprenol L-rhamnosyltransferase
MKDGMQALAANKLIDDRKVPATVIILVHNTPDLLLKCLEGFYSVCRFRGWQIIVVDNGSDESVRFIVEDKFEAIDVIRSERNLGFAAGNNLGLRRAKGEFVLLMNSDVVATAETLEAMVGILQGGPHLGAVSPGLLTAQGEPQAFAFGTDASPGHLIVRGIRFLLGLKSQHNWATQKSLEVDWVSAACICVRRTVINEIGELDERFPFYFEDADWCMRMREAGWKILYCPPLRVIHLGGASRPSGSVNKEDLYYSSLLLYCEKHYGRSWKYILRRFLAVYRILVKVRWRIIECFPKKHRSSKQPFIQ